jgi:hypothetical protein
MTYFSAFLKFVNFTRGIVVPKIIFVNRRLNKATAFLVY